MNKDEKERKWGPGPWVEEEDQCFWEFSGFPCAFLRHSELGTLAGYVAVPPGHSWYRMHYDDIHASAHGGLTFACHASDFGRIEKGAQEEDLWWIGFDAAHYGDLVPMYSRESAEFHRSYQDHQVYRDIPYIMDQVEELAAQAAVVWKTVN